MYMSFHIAIEGDGVKNPSDRAQWLNGLVTMQLWAGDNRVYFFKSEQCLRLIE